MQIQELTAHQADAGINRRKNKNLNNIKNDVMNKNGNIQIDFSEGDENQDGKINPGEYFSFDQEGETTTYYSVNKEDTLEEIAKKFGVSVDDLKKHNDLKPDAHRNPIVRDDDFIKIVKKNKTANDKSKTTNVKAEARNIPKAKQATPVAKTVQPPILLHPDELLRRDIEAKLKAGIPNCEFKVELSEDITKIKVTLVKVKEHGFFSDGKPNLKKIKKVINLPDGTFSEDNEIYKLTNRKESNNRVGSRGYSNNFDYWTLEPDKTFTIDIKKYVKHNSEK